MHIKRVRFAAAVCRIKAANLLADLERHHHLSCEFPFLVFHIIGSRPVTAP